MMGYARAALAVALVGAVSPAAAQDLSGTLAVEFRFFESGTTDPRQISGHGAVSVAPEIYFETDGGSSFTITPYGRLDSGDRERSLLDLREAYFLDYGEFGASEWELRAGIDRVHWGVAESHNIVDIVNQSDLADHPDGKTKLGQPMAYVTLSGDWGAAELLGLVGHRPRRFPGIEGRLRGAIPATGQAAYEHRKGDRHIDFAARISRSIGSVDIGASLFRGTSREPSLVPVAGSACPPSLSPGLLRPCYEQISQFGLDAQWALDEWLLKLEGTKRTGLRDLAGAENGYLASILGVERTIFGIADSAADLTIFAEWLWDGRRARATSIYNRDAFIALRYAANDPMGTELTGSLLADSESESRIFGLEMSRRISDAALLRAEASIVSASDNPTDDPLVHGIRNDSFVSIGLEYRF